MSACDHDMVVSPDPKDGKREVVRCVKCNQSRTRVAVAVEMREAADRELGAVRAEVAALRAEVDALKAKVQP